jgi:hypothetical protein
MSNPVPPADRAAADPFEGIDADLALLAELQPADQVPVFGRVHAALSAALASTANPTTPGGAAAFGRPSGGGR